MNLEDPTPHLERYATYEEACREFRLKVPERFNVARAICRSHSDAVTRVALSEVRRAASNTYTFGALDYLSDKFATVLGDSGIAQGNVVSVMLRQSAALAVAHLGALKLGAIVQPLPLSSDPTQIRSLLEDSGAGALVLDEESRRGLVGIPASVTAIFVASDNIHSHVVAGQDKSFWREIYDASADFRTVDTNSSSPALIFSSFSEGGSIKSVLQSHAALIGSLPAFEMVNNFDLGADSVLWAPADWASIGTLLGAIYPAWYYGLPVIAYAPSPFNSADSLRLIEARRVTVAFLEMAQLRMLKTAHHGPREGGDFRLKHLIAGDVPAPEIVEWARTCFDAAVDTAHGTLEACAFAATCERWFQARAGSVGKAVPGRVVEIVDAEGNELPPEERGRIAIGLPDPAIARIIRGHSREVETAPRDDWFVSTEIGLKDPDGYLVVPH